MNKLAVKILDPRLGDAFPMPTYSTTGSAGLDLLACLDEPATVEPGQSLIVPSGLAIDIGAAGYMAMLAPRSGLGIRHRMILANSVGIIDSDYQNEIKVAMWNAGDKPYTLEPGERICQMIIVSVAQVELEPVEDFARETARGLQGLGHSGRF